MDAVFNGSSIVAATPTASGKSMTYIVPVRHLDGVVSDLKSLSLFSANHVSRIRGSAGGLYGNFIVMKGTKPLVSCLAGARFFDEGAQIASSLHFPR